MSRFQTYTVQLVKEKSGNYAVDRGVSDACDAYNIIRAVYDPDRQPVENLYMLSPDTRNQVIGTHIVSKGNLNTSVLHPREIFQRAILNNANSIILAHNHPSGVSEPSSEDIKVTQNLVDAGKLIGIPLLDHLVIGDHHFTSMKIKDLVHF